MATQLDETSPSLPRANLGDRKERDMVKPDLKEVLAYAEEQIKYYVRKFARDIPEEQKEEMAQDCRLRILNAYETIEADKGWKTFVQTHCFGAVQDYLRRGRGFSEEKWSLKEEREGSEAITQRLDYSDHDDDTPLDVDAIVGLEQEAAPIVDDVLEINWDLIARLCRVDHDLHIFVRHELLGYPLTELTGQFGVTRERLGQRLAAFIELFDDPKQVENPWINQIIFALGLSEKFGIKKEDLGIGWTFIPIDLRKFEETSIDDRGRQLGFNIGGGEAEA